MVTIVEQARALKNEANLRMLPIVEEIEGAYSENGLRVSETAYWETYYHDPDFRYEWNNGILEEKPKAAYGSSQLYQWFFMVLEDYLRTRPIAKTIGLHIGFRLALPKKTSIRRPDLALILNANPIAIANEDCTYQGIFDLCIEILSDATLQEVERDTIVKKTEYCQAGVSEYFILDWKGKEIPLKQLPALERTRKTHTLFAKCVELSEKFHLPEQERVDKFSSRTFYRCMERDE